MAADPSTCTCKKHLACGEVMHILNKRCPVHGTWAKEAAILDAIDNSRAELAKLHADDVALNRSKFDIDKE